MEKWIYEEKLLFNGTTYSWTPKALEDLNFEKSIGKLLKDKHKDITTALPESPEPSEPSVKSSSKEIVLSATFLGEFIGKFSTKNIGIAGKTTDKSSVVKRLIKFLTEYDYTLEEILQATDLYIDTLKQQGSIRFIRECGYFIYKKIDGVDQSDLAKWCYELKNGSGPAYNSHQIL